MSKISFVYFDVGGVAIKDFSDSSKWIELKDYLGLTSDQFRDFEKVYRDQADSIARGKKSTDSVIKIFTDQTGILLPESFSLEKYFVDNFKQNQSIWPVIAEVKKKYRTGLLTDMFPGMLNEIKDRGLFPPVAWEVIVDSSVVGVKKPMPEIYTIAAESAGVPSSEILFIDNMQMNLDGAKQAGWQTHLYNPSDYEKSSQELLKFFNQNSK